jgi:hypothetical protein
LNDGCTFVKEFEDVLGVTIEEWVGKMLDVGGDLEVLHARGSCYYGFYVVLGMLLGVGC